MYQYIWLFGENLGATANNNSYYMWKHILKYDDKIEKKFILEKTKKNKQFVNTLNGKEQQNIIWKNSKQHWEYYYKADMFFVTLSYKDIMPNKTGFKKWQLKLTKPLVYLQHGTLAMKRLGYTGNCYHNNMFRFLYYNPKIKEQFMKENDFKEYQLYNGQFHPRYQALIQKNDVLFKKEKQQILWFLTWREYLGDNDETHQLLENIKTVLEDKKLKDYLEKTGKIIKLCLHQFFDKEKRNTLLENITGNIEIVTPEQVNVMDEIAKSALLITDYSSLGFDFTFLNKPVILYQPDLEKYQEERDFYCTNEELSQYHIKTITDLVKEITSGEYSINTFFKTRLPENIDYEYIRQGKHIDRIYNYFANIQKKDITLIGYNYYGRGGTVAATKSLAEGLLEKGYLVKLLSLKKNRKTEEFPYGLNVKSLYISKSRKPQELIKRILFRQKRFYSHLIHDPNKRLLIPYTGYALKRKLDKINSHTVVSTRESLHLFVKEAKSPMIKNKIYFFHTSPKILGSAFTTLIPELKKVQLENAIFITERNRQQYIKMLDYQHYNNYAVIGNCLTSNMMMKREDIQPIQTKECYRGIYLVRISKDRKQDLDNLLGFGKYLKEKGITNISVDLYGGGDYVEEFTQKLEEANIKKYITYSGLTQEPNKEIKEHDFVIDFSYAQSFGMTYIEAILNGKMVYAYENEGSLEVLSDIPDCYIKEYSDIVEKVKKLNTIKRETLQQNYDKIAKRYSREVVSEAFLKFVNSNNREG